ncbi:dihydroorotate dehydrogenase electron transfer subunit [Roseimaritima ulvae]|uniref:Dihydroorotate dehydrogenase B (NAD(+)), electron transfer subunit n=1 Tax=Roseimaritima ulvae TaxID=980254 RepID=A0A5B9R9B3_9BACT|nr:dihydroorotate dehydrogenase electron transfer subunit [Roseimaritima ulvae]QEG43561.1 Dihydroorotate dehydrogenase B (NAD(+)), electron transfer subunit [Roseimaritima ulvae]
MSGSLQAAYYADDAQQLDAAVVSNQLIARDTYQVRIEAPEIARRVAPGQFVMIRMAGLDDPLIGRALAVYDVGCDPAGQPTTIDLVYLRKGKLTQCLSRATAGSQVTVWGPLGNGFAPQPCEHLVMVAGGIGQTPFVAVAKEALGLQEFAGRPTGWAKQVTLVYGARSADLLAGVEDFQGCGVRVELCTDDGTRGRQALVPQVLDEVLAEAISTTDVEAIRVLCCGPEIMMEKASEVAAVRRVACQVSLETPMACGIGICFSCVAKVRQDDGQWDYKRTCVEGPVFDAAKICWE